MLPTPEDRGRAAAAAVKAAGGSAMDAALEQISVTFDRYSSHYRLKLTVRSAIRRGPDDINNRARYRGYVRAIDDDGLALDTACRMVAAAHRRSAIRNDRLRFAGAAAELRLWLRWMRRHAPRSYDDWLTEMVRPGWMPRVVLVDDVFLEAAE